MDPKELKALKAFKSNRGRPPKINKEIIEKIYTCMVIGSSIESAAAYNGVCRNTLHNWLRKGNKQKSGIYRQFLRRVDEALGACEVRMLKIIEDAATGKPAKTNPDGSVTPGLEPNWKAAEFKLRNMFPHRWAPKESIKLFQSQPGEQFSSTHDHIMGLIHSHEKGGDAHAKEAIEIDSEDVDKKDVQKEE